VVEFFEDAGISGTKGRDNGRASIGCYSRFGMNYFRSPRNHFGSLTQPSRNRCRLMVTATKRRKGAFRALK
jgi:hypothetical protein